MEEVEAEEEEVVEEEEEEEEEKDDETDEINSSMFLFKDNISNFLHNCLIGLEITHTVGCRRTSLTPGNFICS